MYHSTAVSRSSMDEDDRLARDTGSRPGSAVQQPPYSARSPLVSHYHNHSPTKPSVQQSGYPAYSSRPSSSAAMQMPPTINQSGGLGQPHSPTNGLSHLNRSAYTPRETSKSTYYDPTSEHRDINASWNHSPYAGRSPIRVSEACDLEVIFFSFSTG